MPTEKIRPKFVKKKMNINGVIDEVIVPVSGLDEVKHLIVE
ncbi:MAG: hypothetical protein ACMXX6_01870 [Candidatus Woesearchaeota archaeon]